MTLLREALAARHDEDFMIAAPVRRRTPARKKKASAGARLLSLALQHPRRIAVTLLLVGCGGAITWNALVLQTAHHPAPLFNQKEPALQLARPMPPTRPAASLLDPEPHAPAQPAAMIPAPAGAVSAPAAPPRLPSRGAIADMIRNGGEVPQPPVRAAPAPASAVVATPAKPPAMRDTIGDIIRMGGAVPTPPAYVGRAEAGDLILSGQRALVKLGYGVKADGIMGAGTRQAIERFEQERNLPVTGEFSGRTARELSAASGIAVQ
jgi:hypothetical protein